MVKIKSYEGLTAIITGAGSGIGRQLALQLVSQGCSLALCDLRPQILEQTITMCKHILTESNRSTDRFKGGEVVVVGQECDVTKLEEIERFGELVKETFGGKVNILINNAGMVSNGSFLEFDNERFDKVFNVNFQGCLNMTRKFLPMIVKAEVGYVVNVSSANALWCCLGPAKFPFQSLGHTPYCAAKSAVKGFTEALLHDSYQNFPHIGIVCVHPGKIDTNVFIHAEPHIIPEGSNSTNMEAQKSFITLQLKNKASLDELESMTAEELHKLFGETFKNAPGTSASAAAKYILAQTKAGNTRILVGDDAVVLDILSRMFPRLVYNDYFQTAILLPWVGLAQICTKYVGNGFGRFCYPLILSIFGTVGYNVVRSRL